MRFSRIMGVAAIALLAGSAAASADEMAGSAGFDWDGFYAGIGVSASSLSKAGVTYTSGYIDSSIGANVTSGNFLYGAEAVLGAYSSTDGTSGIVGGGELRAGYLFSPEALLYFSGGAIVVGATGATFGYLGTGLEFAVSSDVSIDLEYRYVGWASSGYTGHAISTSALWHF